MNIKPSLIPNLQSISRMIIALVFIITGFDKLMNLNVLYTILAHKEFIASKHMVIIFYSSFELILGLFLLVGYKIRYVAYLLAFQIFLLTFSMHDFWSMLAHEKIINLQFFMKNIIVIFALIYIGSNKPDHLSLDNAYLQLKEQNKQRKPK
ncbi:MAG: DoxX family protein [Gammaproteobacteria bacterium]|nr:DoxX family protein [Gammaproteobacteria bacterium]